MIQIVQIESKKNSVAENKQKLSLLKQPESLFPDIVMCEGSPSKSPLSNRSEKGSKNQVVFATYADKNRQKEEMKVNYHIAG
jgi:hypothetical protein